MILSGNDTAEHHEHHICSYPSCHKRISAGDNGVTWDSVGIEKEEFYYYNLSPLAKLAVVANPIDKSYRDNYFATSIYLHPECAAEWGMHLIKDAIEADSSVAQKLRTTVVKPS